MSCATQDPVFWQRQERLPLPVQRFLRARLEAALESPARRRLLAWPTVLGAPRLRERHPEGVPLEVLLADAKGMLAALGVMDPEEAWAEDLASHPDTADRGATGWVPHRIWEPLASVVSLRAGVALLSLAAQPEDASYRLASAVTLFNSALYHECHDALEELWRRSQGHQRQGLQGLILLAAGYHHQQQHTAPGMLELWRDAQAALEPFDGQLESAWGRISFARALRSVAGRLAWLEEQDEAADLAPLWSMERPEWEFRR